MSATDRRAQPGYVLLVVMWTLVAMATVASAAMLVARQSIAIAANRVALTRAQWVAEGCANSMLLQIESALRDAPSGDPIWAALDSMGFRPAGECGITLRAAGTSLNVNRASELDLIRFGVAAGLEIARAESLAAALEDWRDADGEQRDAGAETEWYRAAGRLEPRNAPFVSSRELLLVRGSEWLPGIDTLLSSIDDPVLLTRAPAAVLAGVPHFGLEAVQAIIAARGRGRIPDLAFLANRLSPPARMELIANVQELLSLTTKVPIAWIIQIKARDAAGGAEARLELRIARDGSRPAVLVKREWP